MAARIPRTNEPASEQPQETHAEIAPELIANFQHIAHAIGDVHGKIDSMAGTLASLERSICPPAPEDNSERAKVLRRRSLDDMQFAMKRLASGESRPADDDSPQVLQDAINEVIALRQIVSDMMQASSNVYQHGLTAIRDMTSR